MVSSDKILIGGQTPIESGYYARLKNGDAVVLNKTSVENVLDIFTQFFATPTPPVLSITPTALHENAETMKVKLLTKIPRY